MNLDVGDIIIKYLQDNGYDGLVYPDNECGCSLDDLCPCDCLNTSCKAGYKVKCDDSCEHEHSTFGGSDWHMQLDKPEVAYSNLAREIRESEGK